MSCAASTPACSSPIVITLTAVSPGSNRCPAVDLIPRATNTLVSSNAGRTFTADPDRRWSPASWSSSAAKPASACTDSTSRRISVREKNCDRRDMTGLISATALPLTVTVTVVPPSYLPKHVGSVVSQVARGHRRHVRNRSILTTHRSGRFVNGHLIRLRSSTTVHPSEQYRATAAEADGGPDPRPLLTTTASARIVGREIRTRISRGWRSTRPSG